MRIDINKIKENPDNPRKITEDLFEKLVNSIKEDPDILEAKPLVVDKQGQDFVVLGGNMRLKALKHLNYEEVPIFDASEWSPETKRRFVVKDNLSMGLWDYDLLAAQYDSEELENWGLSVLKEFDKEEETQEEKGNGPSIKSIAKKVIEYAFHNNCSVTEAMQEIEEQLEV